MASSLRIRRAVLTDASAIDSLLSEWLPSKPDAGRLRSIKTATRNREMLVAQDQERTIGFIHYVKHEDVIDGGPNTFVTAFYVSPRFRGKGIGGLLLDSMIRDSLTMGAVGVETSTIHKLAKKLYERHHFKQTMGDIGEVFLELDIPEYLKAKKRRPSSKTSFRCLCKSRWSPSSGSPRPEPHRGPLSMV